MEHQYESSTNGYTKVCVKNNCVASYLYTFITVSKTNIRPTENCMYT